MKVRHLDHPYSINKEPETMCHVLISKKQYTFLDDYVYKIYSAVLKPNYKCTYDQSDQIKK